jgi:GNAT superfamily N-acetyltransferase
MITYSDSVDGVTLSDLAGFFEGWPSPPSPTRHLDLLRSSAHVWLAHDDEAGGVVGFVTAISDGVLTAYIPLLEVLPEYRGRGIGGQLVQRMLATLDHLYAIDVVCDDDVRPFYDRLGLRACGAMVRRNYANQSGAPRANDA